ncbi:MAG: YwaF family protein [Solobacterium sp.]|nr:YwaF family protein [Solobacterium sp.]
MEHFWTHRDNIPEGLGYGQFSVKHFILIAVTCFFTAGVIRAYSVSGPSGRIIILRCIAAALILIDVIKMIVIARSDVVFTDYLPLEICSFGAYFIVCDSILIDEPFFTVMLLTLFLPGALMAIIFPTTTPLPVCNFFTIHQFLYHGLIIAYVAARFCCLEIPLIYADLWGSIGRILILIGIIYVIDTVFHKNYMFLKDAYGNALLGKIRQVCGGGFAYTVGLILFSIFMIHVFFALFKCIMALMLLL